MSKVFCFGELLLRFSPVLDKTWIRTASMPVYIGGAELNVARALAQWGVPVKYMTALPDHYLSKEIIDDLQSKQIDTSAIQFSGRRIGSYYLPQGTELKGAGVIYDREGSAFSELKPGMIDWNAALKDCSWFHFSAISPALNENIAAVCKEGLEAAAAKGMTISVDLNYRSKLWQYGKQPVEVMPELVKYCSVIMGNIWSAQSLLDVKSSVENSEGRSQQELIDAAGKSMLQLHQQYPSARSFAYTFRLQETYWAVMQHGSDLVVSKEIPIVEVKDKAGSGDCFMAGLIYGMVNRQANQRILDFAAAAAVGKLNEVGDATSQTVFEINSKLVS